jgi:hypothetical protein
MGGPPLVELIALYEKCRARFPRSPIIQPTFAGHHGVEAEAPPEIVGKLLWPSVEFPLV